MLVCKHLSLSFHSISSPLPLSGGPTLSTEQASILRLLLLIIEESFLSTFSVPLFSDNHRLLSTQHFSDTPLCTSLHDRPFSSQLFSSSESIKDYTTSLALTLSFHSLIRSKKHLSQTDYLLDIDAATTDDLRKIQTALTENVPSLFPYISSLATYIFRIAQQRIGTSYTQIQKLKDFKSTWLRRLLFFKHESPVLLLSVFHWCHSARYDQKEETLINHPYFSKIIQHHVTSLFSDVTAQSFIKSFFSLPELQRVNLIFELNKHIYHMRKYGNIDTKVTAYLSVLTELHSALLLLKNIKISGRNRISSCEGMSVSNACHIFEFSLFPLIKNSIKQRYIIDGLLPINYGAAFMLTAKTRLEIVNYISQKSLFNHTTNYQELCVRLLYDTPDTPDASIVRTLVQFCEKRTQSMAKETRLATLIPHLRFLVRFGHRLDRFSLFITTLEERGLRCIKDFGQFPEDAITLIYNPFTEPVTKVKVFHVYASLLSQYISLSKDTHMVPKLMSSLTSYIKHHISPEDLVDYTHHKSYKTYSFTQLNTLCQTLFLDLIQNGISFEDLLTAIFPLFRSFSFLPILFNALCIPPSGSRTLTHRHTPEAMTLLHLIPATDHSSYFEEIFSYYIDFEHTQGTQGPYRSDILFETIIPTLLTHLSTHRSCIFSSLGNYLTSLNDHQQKNAIVFLNSLVQHLLSSTCNDSFFEDATCYLKYVIEPACANKVISGTYLLDLVAYFQVDAYLYAPTLPNAFASFLDTRLNLVSAVTDETIDRLLDIFNKYVLDLDTIVFEAEVDNGNHLMASMIYFCRLLFPNLTLENDYPKIKNQRVRFFLKMVDQFFSTLEDIYRHPELTPFYIHMMLFVSFFSFYDPSISTNQPLNFNDSLEILQNKISSWNSASPMLGYLWEILGDLEYPRPETIKNASIQRALFNLGCFVVDHHSFYHDDKMPHPIDSATRLFLSATHWKLLDQPEFARIEAFYSKFPEWGGLLLPLIYKSGESSIEVRHAFYQKITERIASLHSGGVVCMSIGIIELISHSQSASLDTIVMFFNLLNTYLNKSEDEQKLAFFQNEYFAESMLQIFQSSTHANKAIFMDRFNVLMTHICAKFSATEALRIMITSLSLLDTMYLECCQGGYTDLRPLLENAIDTHIKFFYAHALSLEEIARLNRVFKHDTDFKISRLLMYSSSAVHRILTSTGFLPDDSFPNQLKKLTIFLKLILVDFDRKIDSNHYDSSLLVPVLENLSLIFQDMYRLCSAVDCSQSMIHVAEMHHLLCDSLDSQCLLLTALTLSPDTKALTTTLNHCINAFSERGLLRVASNVSENMLPLITHLQKKLSHSLTSSKHYSTLTDVTNNTIYCATLLQKIRLYINSCNTLNGRIIQQLHHVGSSSENLTDKSRFQCIWTMLMPYATLHHFFSTQDLVGPIITALHSSDAVDELSMYTLLFGSLCKESCHTLAARRIAERVDILFDTHLTFSCDVLDLLTGCIARRFLLTCDQKYPSESIENYECATHFLSAIVKSASHLSQKLNTDKATGKISHYIMHLISIHLLMKFFNFYQVEKKVKALKDLCSAPFSLQGFQVHLITDDNLQDIFSETLGNFLDTYTELFSEASFLTPELSSQSKQKRKKRRQRNVPSTLGLNTPLHAIVYHTLKAIKDAYPSHLTIVL